MLLTLLVSVLYNNCCYNQVFLFSCVCNICSGIPLFFNFHLYNLFFIAKEAFKALFEMNETDNISNGPAVNMPENKTNSADQICRRIVEFIQKGYKIMVLLRGLPGSGKTVLATTLLQHGLGTVNRDEFIFSTDDFFNKGGSYRYNPNEIQEAHTWNQRRAFSNARKGVSPIIIDNTNLEIWEMKVYCTMGVQFGYIIEIVEVSTPWALNPGVLSNKNTHGVDKRKIKLMLDRYERGVTVGHLLAAFKLKYTAQLPQHRTYPPFSVPFQPPRLPNVANGAKKKQPPVEYVHKFENRRKNKPETTVKPDIDQLLGINKSKGSTDDNDYNSDLISFINEMKPTPKTDEVMQPVPTELSKQLEENKQMMGQIVALLSQKSEKAQLPSASDDTLTEDVEMEGTVFSFINFFSKFVFHDWVVRSENKKEENIQFFGGYHKKNNSVSIDHVMNFFFFFSFHFSIFFFT